MYEYIPEACFMFEVTFFILFDRFFALESPGANEAAGVYGKTGESNRG